MKRRIQNQSGQAMIESVVAAPLMLATVAGVLYLIYHATLVFFISFQLEETLICMTGQESSGCEQKMRKSVSKLLLFSEKFSLNVSSDFSHRTGRIEVKSLRAIQISKTIAKKVDSL